MVRSAALYPVVPVLGKQPCSVLKSAVRSNAICISYSNLRLGAV